VKQIPSILTQGRQLPFNPSSVVAERLGNLGRTEDVQFSPDQKRLAIAGFIADKILVVQIEIVSENGVLSIVSDRCVELLCPDFNKPHGLAWLDDETLIVANRKKDVIVVSVPVTSKAGLSVEIEPLLRLSEGGDGIIKSPGSVAVTPLGGQYFEVLVCNNYHHYVSRHIIQRRNGFEVISSLRLFEHDLKVPDSIAVSSDGSLVAVSNHYGRRVDVFLNDSDSTTHSLPVFSLGVTHYPHGVRFAMDDHLLLVADAGAPHVHVFSRDGLAWKEARDPLLSIKVIEDEPFLRGNTNPQEGGPKGLDVLVDGSLFVISCDEVPIAFFDFRAIRDHLVEPSATNHRKVRSSNAQMLDTTIATMKGQHEQIGKLRLELAQMKFEKAMRGRRLDRRFVRLLKRTVRKVLGSDNKR
jgi:hypothetical protein